MSTKIIRPIAVSDAALISTDIAEADYPEWSAEASFAVGGRCMVTATGIHKIYESLIAGNIGHYPPSAAVNESGAAYWLDLGPTNRWGMFDAQIGTYSSRPDEINVTVAVGITDSIAFLELDATEIEVSITDPVEGLVYSKSVSLRDDSAVVDWHAFFFEEIVRKTDVSLFDLPTLSAPVAVRIINAGTDAKCGAMVLGKQFAIGEALPGVTFGITDYSRKERDTFGRPIINKRSYSKRATVELFMPINRFDYISRMLAEYRATPIVWSILSDYSSATIYGYYKDFYVSVKSRNISHCNLEIEGLI